MSSFVPSFRHTEQQTWIARPISFVQFAFGSSAYHPIFVDVVDRIVEMAKVVDAREKWMLEDRKWRKTDEELQFVSQIEAETQRPPVLAVSHIWSDV